MSYQPDYIHMRNLIMRAVTSIAEAPGDSHDEKTDNYSELISFLEEMYVNAVLSLAGTLLAMAKFSTDPEEVDKILRAAREIVEFPQESVPEIMNAKYQMLIEGMNLPDAYQVKTHNEQVAEEILNEATQSDSQ